MEKGKGARTTSGKSSEQAHGLPLTSESALPSYNLRGPHVAISSKGLTRGPRLAPSSAPSRTAQQGAVGNPCSVGFSESRYLPNFRAPYRYVNSDAYIVSSRYPSLVSTSSNQVSWQDGGDQSALWPFYNYFPTWGSWDGYGGYGYYYPDYFSGPTVSRQEAFPFGSSNEFFPAAVSSMGSTVPVADIRPSPFVRVSASSGSDHVRSLSGIHSVPNHSTLRRSGTGVSLSTSSTELPRSFTAPPPLIFSGTSNGGSVPGASTIPTCANILVENGSFLNSFSAYPFNAEQAPEPFQGLRRSLPVGQVSVTPSLSADVRVSSRVNTHSRVLNSDTLDSNRTPVADYPSRGTLGSVVNSFPTDSRVPPVSTLSSASALCSGNSLGLTATSRVATPSRSTPDIVAAISQAVLRALSGLGPLAERLDHPSVAEEGGGASCFGSVWILSQWNG